MRGWPPHARAFLGEEQRSLAVMCPAFTAGSDGFRGSFRHLSSSAARAPVVGGQLDAESIVLTPVYVSCAKGSTEEAQRRACKHE